ncbi:MAG: DNA repair protein RecO [Bacteroidota bacterium]|nr:DNA repair protein RecO [Bacteroidota bacterium]
MIHKTRGIVFHSIKYSETSIITKIYTEKFGLQSYIVRGARKPKARLKASLFQPLFLLEMEVYYKQKSSLQNIKEARSAYVFTSIPFDVRKSSIVLFLSDVLTKAIKEEETNRELFHYLDSKIRQLDMQKEDFADFHIYFMVHLSRYLGFFPQGKYHPQGQVFDMQEGVFTRNRPAHAYHIDPPLSEYFSIIIHHPLYVSSIKMNRDERNMLLEKLIAYYHLHHEGLQDIQSHVVLKEIFNHQ